MPTYTYFHNTYLHWWTGISAQAIFRKIFLTCQSGTKKVLEMFYPSLATVTLKQPMSIVVRVGPTINLSSSQCGRHLCIDPFLMHVANISECTDLQGVPVVEEALQQRRHRTDEVPPALLPHRLPLVQNPRQPEIRLGLEFCI